jgi:serine/threonine-protein kinase
VSGGVRPGDVIAGKFQVERTLGEGGMGFVVAARHLQLGQTVALKFMREEVCSAEYKTRFLREARNTVRLKSMHVSRVLDVGALDGGAPYIVMEYLEGTDLSELLHSRGPVPVQEACEYLVQACHAIAEAHHHGIVHRDLKPANLFLTRGPRGEPIVKVLDFGVSKVLDAPNDDETRAGVRSLGADDRPVDGVVTRASDMLGSPSYMAPEQIMSARDADARSDIWSLGVILFRLVSGQAPFAGASLGELIQAIVHGSIPDLRRAKPDVPPGLEHVVARCLVRERAHRLSDVVELARLLAPYAGPVASPSVERVALLGPALVTSPPRMSMPSVPGFGATPGVLGGPSSVTSPSPISSARAARKDMSSTAAVVWAALFAAVVACVGIVVLRVLRPKARFPRTSSPTVVLPPEVASPDLVDSPVSTPVAATPSVPSGPAVSLSATDVRSPAAPAKTTGGRSHPRVPAAVPIVPKSAPANAGGDIPATRD